MKEEPNEAKEEKKETNKQREDEFVEEKGKKTQE